MTGIEGPRGFLPFIAYALTGDAPSREGARGIAGAVYRLLSSIPKGVPALGKG